jgi:hypothetical protein
MAPGGQRSKVKLGRFRLEETAMTFVGRPYPAVCALLGAAALLAGCSDALTVHPVASATDPTPDVPAIAGTWRYADPDGSVDRTRIVITGEDQAGARCRQLEVTFHDGDAHNTLGDQICFVDFNGHLVAELRSPESSQFYRQYLVRSSEDSFELCAPVPVWLAFEQLAKDYPVGYSLDSLQHTVRKQGDSELMVLISSSKELRDFLTVALPELAAFCDTEKTGEMRWLRFVRSEDEGADGEDGTVEQ